MKQPLVAWVVGVGGLFGYHALYFLALRFAPPAEAGLLNYLWPLLIVLFSSLLPGERLAPHHIIGALLGLAGTVLLFAGNARGIRARPDPGPGGSLPRRLRVGGLFRHVAQAEGGADRRGCGLLSCDRAARRARSRHGRDNRVAGNDGAVACHHRAWCRPGGCGVLCLGHRHEARRYPRAGGRVLRDTVAVDGVSDPRRLCAANRDDCDCRDPDRRRWFDRGERYGVEEEI